MEDKIKELIENLVKEGNRYYKSVVGGNSNGN